MTSTSSPYRLCGNRIRIVKPQPCPECIIMKDAVAATVAASASGRAIIADFPPNSRNVRFNVGADNSTIRLPTAVEPVKDTMSIRGSVNRISATLLFEEGTTLKTQGGISVCSATSLPRRVAFHGVSGDGLRITVLPVARAWAILLLVTSKGKFHGTIAATTPTASLVTRLREFRPIRFPSGRSR